jgi:hypothetical protein
MQGHRNHETWKILAKKKRGTKVPAGAKSPILRPDFGTAGSRALIPAAAEALHAG